MNNKMIKHVVMWRLKDNAAGNDKIKNSEIIIDTLMKLKSEIPEIDSLEVGRNFNPSDAAFDLVLITTHQDKDTLSAYIIHPSHQKVASFIGEVIAERNVVDFEY